MSDDPQVRLGCLELAAQLAKPSGDYSAQTVVQIATVLYAFCQAPPPAQQPVEIADKPRRGRPPKQEDILA